MAVPDLCVESVGVVPPGVQRLARLHPGGMPTGTRGVRWAAVREARREEVKACTPELPVPPFGAPGPGPGTPAAVRRPSRQETDKLQGG